MARVIHPGNTPAKRRHRRSCAEVLRLLAPRDLQAMMRAHQWEALPPKLAALVPRFQDVTVRAITRDADWWCGAERALLRREG
jgi:hypothetical protein